MSNKRSICSKNMCKLITDDGIVVERKKNKIKNFPYPKKSDEWTIYEGDWCCYCRYTQQFMKLKKEKIVYHDVDKLGNKKHVQIKLRSITNNYKTIPLIFHHNKFIGGYTELLTYYPKRNKITKHKIIQQK
jgi:glutaredoxin